MKDLSKTELLIMKCVWGTDHPVTATQIQQILLEKYQTELDRRSLGTLMYRLDQKGYVNVDVSTRVNLYTAKVKEEEARKKKGREILKLWYDGSLDQLVSDLYSADLYEDASLACFDQFLCPGDFSVLAAKRRQTCISI